MAPKPPLRPWKRALRAVAWTAVMASFPIWAAAFLVVPFLAMSGGRRAAIAAGCIVFADVTFWLGGLYLGADVIVRFRPPKVTTGKSFLGKRVAVIGATGGLGQAVARVVQREGGTPLLAARDETRLRVLAAELALEPSQFAVIDVVVPETLRAASVALSSSGPIDYVVCATGMDVCRSLESHSDVEIAQTVDVDLLGPIHVVRAFLPVLAERGVIALFGGFADGGLALPYCSVDVAARAGLAGFCAATNGELELEEREQRLCYVCPAPTHAARPYALLWRKPGTSSVTAVDVANFVLRSVLARRTTAVMGWTPYLLAWLRAAAPWLGHAIVMRRVSPALRARFAPPSSRPPQ